MAATDQQILDEAKDSLLRILQTDTSSWSEQNRQQQQLQIRELRELISDYEGKLVGASGRTLIQPVRRINL